MLLSPYRLSGRVRSEMQGHTYAVVAVVIVGGAVIVALALVECEFEGDQRWLWGTYKNKDTEVMFAVATFELSTVVMVVLTKMGAGEMLYRSSVD